MSRVTPVLLYSLTGAVVLSSLSSCKEKKSEEVKKTMNVVYIMCDDHSYQTISAYDQRYMQTPNIDRIASEGVRFTNSFVANSLSGPSRACMLSGIFLRIFNFGPMLHIKECAPFFRVSGKALHKRSIAILAGMCTAYIGIDRVTAYRQTGLGHDVLCFHLTNEDSIYYFFHDFCTSNTLLNSSGIS